MFMGLQGLDIQVKIVILVIEGEHVRLTPPLDFFYFYFFFKSSKKF